jgi:hypothetical protein
MTPEALEEAEYLRLKAKRHLLGNITFIGELFKLELLSEKIMHNWCVLQSNTGTAVLRGPASQRLVGWGRAQPAPVPGQHQQPRRRRRRVSLQSAQDDWQAGACWSLRWCSACTAAVGAPDHGRTIMVGDSWTMPRPRTPWTSTLSGWPCSRATQISARVCASCFRYIPPRG